MHYQSYSFSFLEDMILIIVRILHIQVILTTIHQEALRTGSLKNPNAVTDQIVIGMLSF